MYKTTVYYMPAKGSITQIKNSKYQKN